MATSIYFPFKKRISMSDAVKSYLSKETLIPISFALALVWPVIYISQLSAKVEMMETKVTILEKSTVSKEVFELKMQNFGDKLDQILKLIEREEEKG